MGIVQGSSFAYTIFTLKLLKFLVPFIIASIAFAVYLLTAPGSMFWLDSARFVASAKILGIPNPPGFPLYMLLGNLFTHLPFGSVVFRMQLLSALATAGTLVLLYRLIGRVAEEIFNLQSSILNLFVASFGTIAFAFTYQMWAQSTNTETFPLVIFLDALILNILLLRKPTKDGLFKRLAVIAFVLGLSTGVNPIVISVVPSVGLFVLSEIKRLSIKKLGALVGLGVLGVVLIYLYFPFRAVQHPFINWNNIQTIEDLLHQMTGKGLNVYAPELGRVNGFTGSGKVFFESLKHYFDMLIANFTYLLLPFIVIGAYQVFKVKKFIFFILSLTLVTNSVLGALYLSGNQESWFLISNLVWATFAAAGYLSVASFLLRVRDGIVLCGVLALTCLSPFIVWFPALNRSKIFITQDYADNLYKGIKEPAILLGSSDIFDATSYFVHEVYTIKPKTVPVVDNLLYLEPWYRDNLKINTDLKIPDVSNFKFDSSKEYSQFLNDFIDLNLPNRKIFLTFPMLRARFFYSPDGSGNFKLDSRFKLVPQGMVFEVVRKDADIVPDVVNYDYQFKTPNFPKSKPKMLERDYNQELAGMINEYAYSFASLGDYLLEALPKEKAKEEALKYYQKALNFNSGNREISDRFKEIQEKGVEATVSGILKVPYGFSRYGGAVITFVYPKDFVVEEGQETILVRDQTGGFRVEINKEIKRVGEKETAQTLAGKSVSKFGTFVNGGPAKITDIEDSFVKVWDDKGVPRMQFFLKNAGKQMEVLVYPSDSPFMKQFEAIIGTMSF